MVESYEDVERFFASLAEEMPDKYGPDQMRADFNAVFLGSAEGRRALYSIFAMCGLYRDPTHFVVDGDPPRRSYSHELTHQNIGRQNLARRIIHAMHNARRQVRPEQTTRTRTKEFV